MIEELVIKICCDKDVYLPVYGLNDLSLNLCGCGFFFPKLEVLTNIFRTFNFFLLASYSYNL